MEINNYFIFVLLICIVFIFQEIKNLKNQVNKNVEHMTAVTSATSDVETIRNLIREEYNHDVEAIRNLGTISKSLLTGKNYHNTTGTTPGRLVIPADVEIQGNLTVNRDSTVNGSSTVNNTLTANELKTRTRIVFGNPDTPENSYVINWNGDNLHLNGYNESDGGNWDKGFMFDYRNHKFENREGHMLLKNTDVDSNSVVDFYINRGFMGLEIAQRGTYNKLRLFQNDGGYDLTNNDIVRYDGDSEDNLTSDSESDSILKKGISARYVFLKSDRQWMHLKKIHIFTTTGIELINRKNSSNQYIIPDTSFCELYRNGSSWIRRSHTHGLHGGDRQAYKVRSHIDYRGLYYHAQHHTDRMWCVDLGRPYEISLITFDYGHEHGRMRHNGGVQLILSNSNTVQTVEFHEGWNNFRKQDARYSVVNHSAGSSYGYWDLTQYRR